MYYDDEYTEQDWREDHDARERAEEQRYEMEMQDPIEESRLDALDAMLTCRLAEFEAAAIRRKPVLPELPANFKFITIQKEVA